MYSLDLDYTNGSILCRNTFTCYCRLETSIVVTRDLVLDIVIATVRVVVVLSGSAHESPVQHVGIGAVLLLVKTGARGGGAWAGAGKTVVWFVGVGELFTVLVHRLF